MFRWVEKGEWNFAFCGRQIGDSIKVPGWAANIMISNDDETIACGSKFDYYVQKWETTTGKPMCEPMKWYEGVHILDEMKRAGLSGNQECDVFVRKDTLPVEAWDAAVSPDKKKCVLGLANGSVAICERR